MAGEAFTRFPLDHPEYTREFLHRQMNEEINGLEMTARNIADFPDAPWELRIAKDAGNVFSSPDGTIYVDEALAQALGSQSGLWAAVLSHEVAHVARRDWGAAIYCNME